MFSRTIEISKVCDILREVIPDCLKDYHIEMDEETEKEFIEYIKINFLLLA